MADTLTAAPVASTAAPPARLWTIDALRGLAALGVTLFHASDLIGMDRSWTVERALDFVINNGRYGVWLFFVISGFCIHLRWASRAARGDMSSPEFVSFWKRRFRRLYPAYFVSLVIYVVLQLSIGYHITPKLVSDFVLHVLLIQNNFPGGDNAINQVFWTLAIEEQLYLLYFVFLMLRRRFGWAVTLCVVMGLRIAWFAVAFALHRAYGWEIVVTQIAIVQWIVWILGALAVEAWFGLVTLPRAWLSPYSLVGAVLVAGTGSHLYLYTLPDGLPRDLLWLFGDVFWAIAFFILINVTIRMESQGAGRFGRWLAGVGLYSYSLYLTHEIITVYGWTQIAWHRPFDTPSLVLLPLVVGAAMVLGRMFFTVFERPFMSAARIRRVDRA